MIKVRRDRFREDGVSILEYVLLVALVAMVATGTLLYLGRGSGQPIACGEQRRQQCVFGQNGARGVPAARQSACRPSDTYWCTSGQSNCTDPIDVSGTEQIQFTLSGGTAPYSFTLQGQQSFMSLDPAKHIINIAPEQLQRRRQLRDLAHRNRQRYTLQTRAR